MALVTEQTSKVWLCKDLRARLTSLLGYFLDQLVGSKQRQAARQGAGAAPVSAAGGASSHGDGLWKPCTRGAYGQGGRPEELQVRVTIARPARVIHVSSAPSCNRTSHQKPRLHRAVLTSLLWQSSKTGVHITCNVPRDLHSAVPPLCRSAPVGSPRAGAPTLCVTAGHTALERCEPLRPPACARLTQARLAALVERLRRAEARAADAEFYGDVPGEFKDILLDSIMLDPVRLPSSHQITRPCRCASRGLQAEGWPPMRAERHTCPLLTLGRCSTAAQSLLTKSATPSTAPT